MQPMLVEMTQYNTARTISFELAGLPPVKRFIGRGLKLTGNPYANFADRRKIIKLPLLSFVERKRLFCLIELVNQKAKIIFGYRIGLNVQN